VGGLRDIVSNPMHATGVGLVLYASHHGQELEAAGLRNGKGVGRVFDRMKAWMFEFF
jgi:cell division protein FtsA